MTIRTKRIMFWIGCLLVLLGGTLTLNNLVQGKNYLVEGILLVMGLALLVGSTESEKKVSASEKFNPKKGNNISGGRKFY